MPATTPDVPKGRLVLTTHDYGQVVVAVLFADNPTENDRQWRSWLALARENGLMLTWEEHVGYEMIQVHRRWSLHEGMKTYRPRGVRRGD